MLISILHKKVLDLVKGQERKEKFTMIPNDLIKSKEFNDAEVRLLSYYQSHTGSNNETSNWNFYDKRALEELGWSSGKLKRTKNSLKDKGWLYIKQVSFDRYDYYIGENAKQIAGD